jgi:CxxC-x17-CxxC domain-containing protein
MEFQDKVLKCVDCGSEFVFTAGEQLFFHDKQFKNEPKRCKPCKSKRAASLGAPPANGGSYVKVETRTSCSGCGKETTVPFKPTRDARCSAANASSSAAPRLLPEPAPEPIGNLSSRPTTKGYVCDLRARRGRVLLFVGWRRA